MVASRRALVALVAVALLAGCSEASDDGTTTPSAESSGADAGVVTWAGGVCAATTDFEAAVQQMTAALRAAPGTPPDQVRTEVSERVGAVRGAADDLRAAVSTSPPGELSKAVATAQDELAATADRARTASEELAAQGEQLAAAQTPAETADALAAARGAFQEAAAGVQAYLASLSATAASRDPVLSNAFAEAPACKARAGASPSSS
jgi:hypothetical protein